MKKKILVVDDDRVMLKFITKFLTREGHEVLTAEDGFAALDLLSSFNPDIIFFDLIMPKIDGKKLIQIVRSMPQLNDCYLVIVSAAVAEIDFDFEETGADSYIAKGPFNSMANHIRETIDISDAPRDREDPKPIRGLDGVYARQLTKELLSRNRHLETILESMAEGILEVYANKVVYANGVAMSLLASSPEKILAKKSRRAIKRPRLAYVLGGKSAIDIGRRTRNRDGKTICTKTPQESIGNRNCGAGGRTYSQT